MNKKFSIISITKNNRSGLARTLKSIKFQIYTDFELIIVDGNSTDGTQNLIAAYKDIVTFVIKDNGSGIYAAMNLGIEAANGMWVIFMNAGDCFANEYVLSNLPEDPDAYIMYGRTWTQRNDRKTLEHPPRFFWQRMPTAQQAMFYKRDLFKRKKFDVRLTIAADYEFYLFVKKTGLLITELDYDVALIESGGLSETEIIKRVWQTYKATVRYFHSYEVHRFYILKLLWATKNQLKRIYKR